MNLDNLNLIEAAENNNETRIKKLLTNSQADIHFNNDKALLILAEKENWQMVQYLLKSTHLKENANVHAQYDTLLIHTIKKNNKPMLKWLINTFENFNLDHAIRETVNQNNFELFKYLLISPELKTHASVRLSTHLCNRWDYSVDLVHYVSDKHREIDIAKSYLNFLLIEYKNPVNNKHYYFSFAKSFINGDYFSNDIKKYVAECLQKRELLAPVTLTEKIFAFLF